MVYAYTNKARQPLHTYPQPYNGDTHHESQVIATCYNSAKYVFSPGSMTQQPALGGVFLFGCLSVRCSERLWDDMEAKSNNWDWMCMLDVGLLWPPTPKEYLK